jgi:hypothetical protein
MESKQRSSASGEDKSQAQAAAEEKKEKPKRGRKAKPKRGKTSPVPLTQGQYDTFISYQLWKGGKTGKTTKMDRLWPRSSLHFGATKNFRSEWTA